MTYVPFARKYRPRLFREVVGQDVPVRIIRNALKRGNVSHAYLFAGPRGVGKTTVARILAKALNCVSLSEEGEPCGSCENCIEIDRGSFPDLVEIDAASNRGIDDVRAIREAVNYRPLKGSYKVYIIDEAHMLTKEAFNALLKTLEEPPPNTVFILCTTEYDRILPTILSRCQRIIFRRADSENIVNYLKRICEFEGIEYTQEALKLISELADGSMRDAASLLDQAAIYTENNLEEESLKELLGILTKSEVLDFLKLLLESRVDEALNTLDELYYRGYNLERFWELLSKEVNNLILFLALENPEKLLGDTELYRDFKGQPLERLLYLEEVINRGSLDSRGRDSLSAYRLAIVKSYLVKDILSLSKLVEGGISIEESKNKREDSFLKEALTRARKVEEGGKTVFLFEEADYKVVEDRIAELKKMYPEAEFRVVKKKGSGEDTMRLF